MDLTIGLAVMAFAILLLVVAIGISIAYNRLQGVHSTTVHDRDSFLSILEASNDALFVINFVSGKIHLANAKASELIGISTNELTTLTIFDLHPKEFLHRSADRIADAWEKKGNIYSDIPLLSSTSEVIPVESSTRVSSYKGEPAVILYARDIRERLELQNEVEEQQMIVREQNHQLLSSIRYAQRIQRAVLPEAEGLQTLLPESFILFRPKDIVSGDLYWFAEQDGAVVLVAADCTGHGVPGALLTLIGATLFNDVVLKKKVTDTGAILDAVRSGMIQALSKDGDEARHDGMNAAVLRYDPRTKDVYYSGGYTPLYVVRNGELTEQKGDRMPVGPHTGDMGSFSSGSIQLQLGDRLFICSDGLQDQFGGPQGKKLKSSGLKDWLVKTSYLTIDEQYQAISDNFRMWLGKGEQIDDVLLVGFEVT
ncbi:MAG: SpoIIE family protein phosphatase [Flavobacteriales bacterium]|nr:SpoIIE family protein phosphatase [Flavobacteriales bacterium]